ncbi:hypothetical protein [Aureisphaera sp.]
MLLLDICICAIIFFLGINLRNLYRGFTAKEKKWLLLLFFFHFAISIAFHFYVSSSGGDAIKFWNLPKNGTFSDVVFLVVNRRASSFIYFFNYFPANVLQLSFFTGNMLYSFLGYFGFIYLLKIFKDVFGTTEDLMKFKFLGIPMFPFILFLPNLHFWSSGIGKDAILFFCVIAFVYALLNLKKRIVLFSICLLLTILIRPHITMFLIVSTGIAYLLDGNLKTYQKIFAFVILAGVFGSMFNYVIQFIQIDNLELSTIQEFTSSRGADLASDRTGSSVDMSGYPFPLKVFTFLYRPLFIDGGGVLSLLSSVENLFLLFLTYKVLVNRPLRSFRKGNYVIKTIVIFFVIGSISFSLILGNLGIMLRQKNMFFPILFLFIFWTLYNNNYNKLYANEGIASN